MKIWLSKTNFRLFNLLSTDFKIFMTNPVSLFLPEDTYIGQEICQLKRDGGAHPVGSAR
jgi:hypothetical protein